MQHDDEIAIFQKFGNWLIFLDVARLRLDAIFIFEIHIQNISPTFIYEAREAGYLSFDGYLHSLASSHANFHRFLLLRSVVESDVNVTLIHVASATGSTQTLRYRFRCHTRFAAKRLVKYITRA